MSKSSPPPASDTPSYLLADHTGPWQVYLEQINRVAPYLGDLNYWIDALKHPKRSLIVDVPIELDNGTIAHYEGYRVQHNTSRGPAKGGVRFHPDISLSEVMALAAWMTIKNAAANLPFGGSKGGVRVDPQALSSGELQRLTRRYTSEITPFIGPNKDIPAPDVNTDSCIMSWMMDTYCVNTGTTMTGIVTGKPVALGGSLGRYEATGRGVFVASIEAARRIGMSIENSRVAVQGFGSVGSIAARLFRKAGARVVAIQDKSGSIYNASGINIEALSKHVNTLGGVHGFTNADEITNDAFWATDIDILIPAAFENQITATNAPNIRARLIVEGANGPTTPAADDILNDKGIIIVPDVIANAGGVTVSYFEWVQDFSSFFWTEDEINERLARIMRDAFASVWQISHDHNVTLRTAAFILACTRILEARSQRGLYP